MQCIAFASSRYEVPELLIHAILSKENGRSGACVRTPGGSYDCGLGQINSLWFKYFEKQGVSPYSLVHDSCTNIAASAYVLKKFYILKKGNWQDAIIAYNIGPYKWTPNRYRIGTAYAKDVIARWWGFHNYVVAKK